MKDLTIGNEGKIIFNFALPMLIGNVFQQLYNVIDSIIVGNYLGNEALAAVGASFPIFFALISLIIGLASGAGTVISQNFGAKKMEQVQQGVDTMFILMFFASIVISFLGIFFIDDIFELISTPASVLPQAKDFLTIILLGLFTAFGFNGVATILRCLGDSKTPLYFLIISTLSNIVLVLLFVLVFKWGVSGAAFATVCSQGGAFITGVIYINKKHKLIKIHLFNLKFNKEIFIKSFTIGIPMGLQQMFIAIGMSAIFKIVNRYDTTVIAAYSVAGRIDSFAVMPAMNFSQALSAFAGQNIGAKKFDRVKAGLKSTILMSSLFSVVISAIVLLFGKQLMGIFTTDIKVIEIGQHYFYIVGGFYIFFSIMFTTTGVFRGAGDTIIPMFITLFSLWLIRIPISYYLSQHYGEQGIWMGIPGAWFFGVVVSTLYYYTGKWKNKKIV